MPYTVVGERRIERKTSASRFLSVVVLNRGGRFNRADYFAELQSAGPDEIISIEPAGTPYDVESLANRHGNLRFLLLHSDCNRGQQVNIGIQEAHGRFVLVLWNDMQVSAIPGRVFERMQEENLLCAVPVLRNDRNEVVPSIQAPAFFKKLLRVVSVLPARENMPTLFPFDYTGVYNRERYLLTGGYDGDMTSSYWQKMDFGFRVHMWGERIRSNQLFRLSCATQPPPEDVTPDADYRVFYLRNLSVRYSGDHGVLPFSRFLPFHFRVGSGLLQSFRLFRAVQSWVETNRYRFVQDARSVTDLWEVQER
ncbi:glycosyltransferase family 2 protein [Salinispira pacifica]